MPCNVPSKRCFDLRIQRVDTRTASHLSCTRCRYDRRPLVLETLTLSCWGLDNSPILLLVHDAMAASHAEETDDLTIYVQSNGWPSGFIKALSKKPRPLESVILDQNLATELISDAREFLASGQWYADVGIPCKKRAILRAFVSFVLPRHFGGYPCGCRCAVCLTQSWRCWPPRSPWLFAARSTRVRKDVVLSGARRRSQAGRVHVDPVRSVAQRQLARREPPRSSGEFDHHARRCRRCLFRPRGSGDDKAFRGHLFWTLERHRWCRVAGRPSLRELLPGPGPPLASPATPPPLHSTASHRRRPTMGFSLITHHKLPDLANGSCSHAC